MRASIKGKKIALYPFQLAYALTMVLLTSSGINCIVGAVICSQLYLVPQWICASVMLAGFGLLLGALELRRRFSRRSKDA